MVGVSVAFGLGAVFLPFALRVLPEPLCRHKAVFCLGIETGLLVLLLWLAARWSGAGWFPLPVLPGSAAGCGRPSAWGWGWR